MFPFYSTFQRVFHSLIVTDKTSYIYTAANHKSIPIIARAI